MEGEGGRLEGIRSEEGEEKEEEQEEGCAEGGERY